MRAYRFATRSIRWFHDRISKIIRTIYYQLIELQMRPDSPITDYFNDSSDEEEETNNTSNSDKEKDLKTKGIVQKFNFAELKTDSDTDEDQLSNLLDI